MNMAVDQIQVLKDQNKTFNIFSVPRTTVLCEDVLEKEKLAHCTYFSTPFPYLDPIFLYKPLTPILN